MNLTYLHEKKAPDRHYDHNLSRGYIMEQENVKLTIDSLPVAVPKGSTILEAARELGINIPTLCFLKEVNAIGACRVCLVEIEGFRTLQPACVHPVAEGLVVSTNSKRVRESRKTVVELLVSNHSMECLTCYRNQNCELQSMAWELNLKDVRFEGERLSEPVDKSSPALMREPEKCILCYRCIQICSKIVTANVYSVINRGFKAFAAPAFNKGLNDVACTTCGQCVTVCPTAALREIDDTGRAWDALADPDKYVVVQTAPSVRVTLGEEFEYPIGHLVTGKMVNALRKLGFDKVFDTDLTADLTIVEEGAEFLEKLKNGGPFPHLSSCSPGWVKFCEHFYPEMLDNMSTVKSPHSMFGALAKTYHAEQVGVDPAKMVVVSIMPCTAKKYELARPEMSDSGYQDVDICLTVRELARMIREMGIDFRDLPDEDFDTPLGISTGAGVLFGTTGGVSEAAIRTIYHWATGKELHQPEFVQAVRGMDGNKVAEIDLPQGRIRFAIAHGTGNARLLLDQIKTGKEMYHWIEIMGCPGGCIGGGGQPILSSRQRWAHDRDYRLDRQDAIYREDERMPLRKAHENPSVFAIYRDFLHHPLSEKSRKLLHTHYTRRPKTVYREEVTADNAPFPNWHR